MKRVVSKELEAVRRELGIKGKRVPKFRKASKEEIARSVANFHAIVDAIAKLDLGPCNAVEMIREMRDKD